MIKILDKTFAILEKPAQKSPHPCRIGGNWRRSSGSTIPVWQLLDGKVREAIPVYVNGWFAPALPRTNSPKKPR